MRTLLTVLLSWLMPPSGRHRAENHPTSPARRHARHTPDPSRSPLPTPRSPYTVHEVIRADGFPVVRPYLLRHEEAVAAA
ncbi:hypothetical protein GCM10010365_47900 [Streptomyces poonensis]|uniref:Uncharacterized protein n=1 Tax=Streptomyces poonensis TaxID=68255 RepID=A0A918UN52_9ACTN|nr:hypothetical protein GCM10010365_47900 [Streptomyces poonensis]